MDNPTLTNKQNHICAHLRLGQTKDDKIVICCFTLHM